MAASTFAEGGTATVADSLARLSGGALNWLGHNLDFFNPYSAGAQLSGYWKAKAALELRLLHYCWEGLYPADGRRADFDDLVRTLWQLPDFQRLVTSRPDHPAYYALIYAALAPDGIDQALRDATLAILQAEGYLSGAGQSALLRLQTRYFADKAGFEHEIEPYEELIEQSILVKLPATRPVTIQDAYSIAHASFYLSDYGGKPTGLAPDRLAIAVRLVSRMLNYCAIQDMWDLAAELVITLSCLGVDPVSSPSGAAGIRGLARAQLPSGALPGRSAAQQADESASPADFFNRAYHTTLMAALIPFIASRGGCSPRADL
jgi:hypothetical protein